MKINLAQSFDVEMLRRNLAVSFINPASIEEVLKRDVSRIVFFSDGILLAKVFSLLYGVKVDRCSFDFTSLAGKVFEYVKRDNKKIYFFGGSEKEISLFVDKIGKLYPGIRVVGYTNGYVGKEKWVDVVFEIKENNTDFVIVGLGAGLQEDFINYLLASKFSGSVYSCGGFIRQESACSGPYYPYLIDKLNARWLYRIFKEPHTIKRYFSYPVYLSKFLWNIRSRKVVINVGDKKC